VFKSLIASIFCFVATLVHAQQGNVKLEAYEQKLPISSLHFLMVPIPAGQFKMGTAAVNTKFAKNKC
jgi:hypothetical protein